MDDMLLMLVHPTGEGDDKKGNRVQERAHCRKLSRWLSRALLLNVFDQFGFLHTTGH